MDVLTPIEIARKTLNPVQTWRHVMDAVCAAFHTTPHVIYGHRRQPYLVAARTVIVMIMIRRGMTYSQIGALMNRDHSSIIHLADTYAKRCKQEPLIGLVVERLTNELGLN